MSEMVYVVVNGGMCYGAFTDESLANEVAAFNNADVCMTTLVRSRQEHWNNEYEKQVIG